MQTLVLTCNRKLDVLVSTGSISISNVEKENSPLYSKNVVTDLEKEIMNLEETTLVVTPQSTIGSNKLNDPPMELSFAQYVRKRVWQCI